LNWQGNDVRGEGNGKPEAFRRELKATCERLGREMPEIKFKGEAEVKPRGPRPARPGKSAQT
jgi:hypothetical protein